MLMGLMLIVMLAGMIIQFIRKYILQIKDPTHQEVWDQLEETEWFQNLIKDPIYKSLILQEKENGILSDPYYIEKLINHDGTKEGFVKYLKKLIR